MTRETVTLEDQARGYWVASVIFRRRHVPDEFRESFSPAGVLDLDEARACAAETIAVLGSLATLPRLRSRIMKEYPSLLPVRAAP